MEKQKNRIELLIEAAKNELLGKVLVIGKSHHLTDLESDICQAILIDNKNFFEVGQANMLTQIRVKQIFERSVMRQKRILDNINTRSLSFDELSAKYFSLLEKHNAINENISVVESLDDRINQFPNTVAKILNARIQETKISGRAKRVCQGAGFKFVSEIVDVDPDYLLKFRNCGKGTINDQQKW